MAGYAFKRRMTPRPQEPPAGALGFRRASGTHLQPGLARCVVAKCGLAALVGSLRKILTIATFGVSFSHCLLSFHVAAECGLAGSCGHY